MTDRKPKPNVERKCGNCTWWARAEAYRWGTCLCPLPDWVDEQHGPTCFPDAWPNCETFAPKESDE
jgi:hypothetical protein